MVPRREYRSGATLWPWRGGNKTRNETTLPASLTDDDLPALRAAFEAEYRRQFSRPVPGMRIEILNWAVRASTLALPPPTTTPPLPALPVTASRWRTIYCDHSGKEVEAALYNRNELSTGHTLRGPALISEPQTTTLVSTGWHATIDGNGNIILEDRR